MRILVIGGTGFISTRLVDFLHEAGHEVTTLNRGQSTSRANGGIERLHADRHDESRISKLLSGRRFDVVYDMVAYTPEETGTMVRLLDGLVERFIHCSTVSVYMVSDRVQCPITEDQDKLPLMPYDPQNPFGMDYGILKRQCEDVLWAAHEEGRFHVSMLRPPFVCGPNDPTIRDLFWIERIRDGGPLLVPGSGDFAFQNVFVDDVARAFAQLLDHPETVGRAYNVAADEIFTLNEYLGKLSRLLESTPSSSRHWGSGSTTVGGSGSLPSSQRRRGSTTAVSPAKATPESIHIPQAVFDRQPFSTNPRGDVFPFNTRRTAIFSLEAIRRDLAYRSTPFDSWMPATIDWYRNHCDRRSHGNEFRQDEIAFAREWKGPATP